VKRRLSLTVRGLLCWDAVIEATAEAMREERPFKWLEERPQS
jgi:hypothetical protein